MKIAIVGPGALGCAYAARLAAAGHAVTLLARRADQSEKINAEGIVLTSPSGAERAQPTATTDPAALAAVDFVIVLVKAYDTDSAARQLAATTQSTPILTLQSGLGNVETLASICGKDRILAGVSYLGGRRTSDNEVTIGGNLRTVVGEVTGSETPRLRAITEALRAGRFEAEMAPNIHEAVWNKLLVICAQNAIGALTGLTFGEMLQSASCQKIIAGVLAELDSVARSLSISLPSDPVRKVLDNWRTLPEHRPSMWQDLQAGRKTEVDAMNGAVAELGRQHQLATPWNQLITLLIHMIEEGRHINRPA